MRIRARIFAFVLALLISGTASAQESKGWLGADVLDVTKAEADKLGWDAPHGARVGVVASGSPADKAGLKTSDIIVAVERTMLETSSEVAAAIAAMPPGAVVRLQILSGGRERSVSVTLAEWPKIQAAEGQERPLLMLDTGGHMTIIRALTFTPDGKQLVSAGDDKVIRVWDWQAGKTIRTIRGEVSPGPEGQIYAIALSPDAKWLAAGGWMHPQCADLCAEIRLYDFSTGKLVALLKGHTSITHSLAFSPDGKRLISGSGDHSAIIWDIASRKAAHRLQGHAEDVYSVTFSPDGDRAVTGSIDTTLRLWRTSDGGLITEMKGHKGQVHALAVRSSDGLIVSGDWAGEIRLWDGKNGQSLRTLGDQGSPVAAVRFSPDGKRLVSTCEQHCSGQYTFVWDVSTGERLHARQHDDVVAALAIPPKGTLAATGSGTGEIRIWDLETGTLAKGPGGNPLVLVGTGVPARAVGFAPNGQRTAWGSADPCPKVMFCPNAIGRLSYQLQLPAGGRPVGRPEPIGEAAAKIFLRAKAAHGQYTLAHRKGGDFGYDAILDLKKNHRVIVSIERGTFDGSAHLAYSFSPDGKTVISGGANGILASYDLNGQRVGSFVGHESVIWAVTASPDGRYLVSGSNDQTVRLWNLRTRELIVTLFRGTDGEWVIWTPQGYYTGSPGADKIVGWQINKGADQLPDYVGAEQLRQHLNRPDIVERAIIVASAEQAVRESPGTTFKLADLLNRPVPRFKIVSPSADVTQHGGGATVRIAIEDTPDPIKAIRVQVNGRQIDEQTPDVGSGGFEAGERILNVPLAKGRNEIRITLTNAIGEKAETLTLMHEGDGALDKRGTLYILAIGVEKYPGLGKTCGENGAQSCDLRFSGADARALVAAVEARLGPAHSKVVKRLLVNGAGGNDDPTAANILNAIDLLKEANETDTVLVFIAGHGFNDGPNYRFLPTNAEWTGSALRGATVVPWYALQEAIETAKGRRILLVDTCHAGNAYNQTLSNAAYHANIIAYTAARFDQEALEDSKLGHGLFTYAVVEGLRGAGAPEGRLRLSTKELADYVTKRVEELAKEQNAEQEPQYFKSRDAEDYVLGQ
jgi:WD40 repeat protein